MYLDCESASTTVCGVLETQESIVVGGSAGGVGVRTFTFSFERTLCGSSGTSPDPLNPARIFSSVIEEKKASLNALRNSTFVTWLMCARTRFSTCRLYTFFSGPKYPTSSG